ncbi:beta-sarcoglycan-like [Homarus americanus]|uniref:Beta-sarcoglycan n=1 Tax=Homarus americanus TaxID=6706 RepID=A0A8J5TK15_HOMAM|nr:beta-sarcoglycan-like [Homarus americanus]XP_042225296.1 beta-sarcoglycan-like [Homarus americanus]KAG7177074.1 Beta-sarcoglycan-like [Homarus americanus]
MGDSAAASLLADSTSLATSTLERATLTARSTTHTTSCERETTPKRSEAQHGESGFFWGLVVVLLLLACGNLLLTFFAMGVLRLGYGMESIEFLPGTETTKFYGRADLGNVDKRDGLIYSYSDTPFSIQGDNSKVSLTLMTSNTPPVLNVSPDRTEIRSVDSFQVVDPHSGSTVFSTNYPNFGLPQGVKNLNVKRSRTARITSPTFSDLKIRSDSTIRLKGNEGMSFDGGKLTWSADQDIYVKSINGSILLETESGIMVDVNTLPLVDNVDKANVRGQYKLCMCMPQGQLFRIPVPTDNNRRKSENKINCASFTNPCSSVE